MVHRLRRLRWHLLGSLALAAVVLSAVLLPGRAEALINMWPPVRSGIVTQEFSSAHLGMDIAPGASWSVYASSYGIVEDARTGSYRGDTGAGGSGNFIVIRHSPGGFYNSTCRFDRVTYSKYLHLGEVYTSKGAWVMAGQLIGRIGNTGNTVGPTGNHLHFEVRKGDRQGAAANPRSYIRFPDDQKWRECA
jgi:murein DD-endopeptidase MepM/ murein hydrolase activator NlpD